MTAIADPTERVRASRPPGYLSRTVRAPQTEQLADGTIGYYPQPGRGDQCWQAVVASCLQVPLDQVPDGHLRKRWRAGESAEEITRSVWAEFERWLAGRGLRMRKHPTVPVRSARWIGVVPLAAGPFDDHCMLLGRGGEVLFDPATSLHAVAFTRIFESLGVRVPDLTPRRWGPEDVAFGYSFVRRR